MEDNGEVRTINLDQLISRNSDQLELKIRNETDEDADARRVRDAADAKLKRMQSLILFLFALLVTGTVFIACIIVAITGSPEDKKWACSIVTGISSGLVGYLVGQAKK
jgi:lipopolysaccharide/colanic/teichoic acid biosynthesis glycosyltransferase